jgi:hypothetical protein
MCRKTLVLFYLCNDDCNSWDKDAKLIHTGIPTNIKKMTSEVNQNGKLRNEGTDGITHPGYNACSLFVRRRREISVSLLIL